jgi:hypothetical protein
VAEEAAGAEVVAAERELEARAPRRPLQVILLAGLRREL